jgi:ribonucleotide monophosphatase NagD (HAD superfamily)
MICANPDLIVNVGAKMAICAGLLAQRYEELGGKVRYHGKPYGPVYHRCRELLGIGDARRILAVGDSLRTDVAGANGAGLDVALVTGGIHKEETAVVGGDRPDPGKLAELAEATGFKPDYAVPHFVW